MNGNLAFRGAAIAAVGAVVALAALALGLAGDVPAGAWIALAIIALGLAALAGFAMFRDTQRAIADVVGAASRLGAAEFDERVAVTPFAAELTSTFNTMARRVQELFREVSAEHARLEAVFDASTDGMVAISRDTGVRFMNPAAVGMLGTSVEAALGRPLIEAVRDYELDALVRRVADSQGLGETVVITYGPLRTPLRAAAVPVPLGGDWAVLLMLADLTEVTRVDQVRRDFLSNVSHELRTPLASIRALAETLESDAVEPGEESREFVRRIRQQTDRMTTLVNELLDLSRIESGAVQLRPETIDLASLVQESVSLLRQRLDAANVRIEAPAAPGLSIEGDHASLLRVVNNLLDNAIKYSPEGSLIEVEARDEGELVALSVRDHGPGIAPQDLPRVFERFYKADPSRTQTHSNGVGLGLAIVKHTVRLHGGTAEATSEPGGGAIFTVRLPRQFMPTRTAARLPRVESPHEHNHVANK